MKLLLQYTAHRLSTSFRTTLPSSSRTYNRYNILTLCVQREYNIYRSTLYTTYTEYGILSTQQRVPHNILYTQRECTSLLCEFRRREYAQKLYTGSKIHTQSSIIIDCMLCVNVFFIIVRIYYTVVCIYTHTQRVIYAYDNNFTYRVCQPEEEKNQPRTSALNTDTLLLILICLLNNLII